MTLTRTCPAGPARLLWAAAGRALALAALLAAAAAQAGGTPPAWHDSLAPLPDGDWNRARAAHLLERAGFGGTPQEIDRLAAMSPREAVRSLVRYGNQDDPQPDFVDSGAFDPGLDPFEPSRPAATDKARAAGAALGVKTKPGGNRRLQQVSDRYLYWLRVSRLESQRVAYWWAHRMLTTHRPLQEKMTLFWHGHFATSDEKVRDYRKMLQQNEMLRRHATGNVRELVHAVARDPAMLVFLDAAVNVKGRPNENFAREIMELFTLGVGHYSEQDIREAARAFTGWNCRGLDFVANPAEHDDGPKTVLGRSGRFDGDEVIDILLDRPEAAEFIAAKLYRFLVRDELSPALQVRLGALLRDADYELAPFLETLLLSQDFYDDASMASHIKSPVELVVGTYRKLGLHEVPGIPDFNDVTAAMGQKLLFPPNVAGWPQGRSWITPGLLFDRGNFAYDTLFAPINFVANDRVPPEYFGILPVAERLAQGQSVSAATRPGNEPLATEDARRDRQEEFNTRLSSYRAWRQATEKVLPIVRAPARVDLAGMVRTAGARTARQAVNVLAGRFLSTPLDEALTDRLARMLADELGTQDLAAADSYMEEGLRNLLHVILSLPAYQLG